METNNKKQLRMRYYIDKPFQNQFMLRFSLIIILVLVLALTILFLLSLNPYSKVFRFFMPGDSGLVFISKIGSGSGGGAHVVRQWVPINAFQLLWKPVLFISGINLILIILFSLFYSHSMAGPIHNIKSVLEDLLAGEEPRPIRIRKGDQFQDLADLLTKVIEKRVK